MIRITISIDSIRNILEAAASILFPHKIMADKPGQKKQMPSLFLCGLPEEVNEVMLGQHFEKFGTRAKPVTILKDHNSQKSKGLAIVEFHSVEEG